MRFPFSPPDDDDDHDEAVVVGSTSSNSNNNNDDDDDDDRSGCLAIPTTTSPIPPPVQHHQRQKATNLFHSWYEGGSKEVGVGGKRVGAIRLKAGESSVPIASQSQLSSYNLYRNVQARKRIGMGRGIDDDSGDRGVVVGGVGVVGSSMDEDGIALWITMLKKTNLVYQREKARLFQCSSSSSSSSSCSSSNSSSCRSSSSSSNSRSSSSSSNSSSSSTSSSNSRSGSSGSSSSSNRGPFESWPSSDPVMAQWRTSLYPSELTTMR